MDDYFELVSYGLENEDLGKISQISFTTGLTSQNFNEFQKYLQHIILDQPLFILFKFNHKNHNNDLKRLKLLGDLSTKISSQLFIIFSQKNTEVLDIILQLSLSSHNILFSQEPLLDWQGKIKTILKESIEKPNYLSFEEYGAEVKISLDASIKRLGELSCTISSPLYLNGNTPIEFHGDLFSQIDISYFDLKKLGHPHATRSDEFITEFSFRGLPESSAKRIRAQRNKWR